MKKIFIPIFFLALIPQLVFAHTPDKQTPFTIFSGDKKASFFAVARGICAVFNRHHGNNYECIAVVSKGSEKNLHSLASDEADFGIVKTAEFNKIFVKNFSEFENKIDFVARIHDEYLTILVQKKLKIKSLSDLSKRVVNIGSVGSSSALITQKYFSTYDIQPKEIVNFGAAESLKKICDKNIDAWVYFIGHPNVGFQNALEKCDVELISLPQEEAENFLKIAPFLNKGIISREQYSLEAKDIKTISSQTIIAARKGIDQNILKLIQDIIANHKEELMKESAIFKGF